MRASRVLMPAMRASPVLTPAMRGTPAMHTNPPMRGIHANPGKFKFYGSFFISSPILGFHILLSRY
jgi:hypothetical protein